MRTANEMYRLSLSELRTILKVEGKQADDFGFVETSRYLRLQNDKSVWAEEMAAHSELDPNTKIDLISRAEHPARFQKEIIDRFAALVPGVKDYEHALYCRQMTLDSGKIGTVLLDVLKARRNVELCTGAEVASCKIGEKGLVEAVHLANGKSITCDVLVLAQGAWAAFDIRKIFGETLPMI